MQAFKGSNVKLLMAKPPVAWNIRSNHCLVAVIQLKLILQAYVRIVTHVGLAVHADLHVD